MHDAKDNCEQNCQLKKSENLQLVFAFTYVYL